jgi:hypothetical protein
VIYIYIYIYIYIPLTLNKYLYGNGNPVINIDPTGKMSLIDITISKRESDKIRQADNARVAQGGRAARNGLSRNQIQRLAKLGKAVTIDNRRLMTHISPGHIRQTAQNVMTKSKFLSNNPAKVQGLIRQTLNNPTTVTQNTGGRPGFIFTRVFPKPVGTTPAGTPVNAVKVVVYPNFTVNTAYPVPFIF